MPENSVALPRCAASCFDSSIRISRVGRKGTDYSPWRIGSPGRARSSAAADVLRWRPVAVQNPVRQGLVDASVVRSRTASCPKRRWLHPGDTRARRCHTGAPGAGYHRHSPAEHAHRRSGTSVLGDVHSGGQPSAQVPGRVVAQSRQLPVGIRDQPGCQYRDAVGHAGQRGDVQLRRHGHRHLSRSDHDGAARVHPGDRAELHRRRRSPAVRRRRAPRARRMHS